MNSYTYDWRKGISDDPDWGMQTRFAGEENGPLETRLNGVKVEGKICGLKTGPHGFIDRYILDSAGNVQLDSTGNEVAIERLQGNVEMTKGAVRRGLA